MPRQIHRRLILPVIDLRVDDGEDGDYDEDERATTTTTTWRANNVPLSCARIGFRIFG